MARITRETVSDLALAELRRDILRQRLQPGDRLREEAVAKELGISRPTVREVFKTLLAEGLLTRNDSTRGLEVTHLDTEDIREIYHARRFLELSGVEAARTAPAADLERLRQTVEDMAVAVANDDPSALVAADTSCHEIIVGFLQSRYLSQLHRSMMTRLRLAMSRLEHDPHRDNRAVYEVHKEFTDALLAGDHARAAANLEERLRASERLILDQERVPD